MKTSEVTALIAIMKAAWAWAKFEDATIAVYRNEWAGLPLDLATVAMRECIRELERPPSIAELIRRVEAKTKRLVANASPIPQLPPAQRLSNVEAREAIAAVLRKWNNRDD